VEPFTQKNHDDLFVRISAVRLRKCPSALLGVPPVTRSGPAGLRDWLTYPTRLRKCPKDVLLGRCWAHLFSTSYLSLGTARGTRQVRPPVQQGWRVYVSASPKEREPTRKRGKFQLAIAAVIWLGHQIPCFCSTERLRKKEKRHSKELREKRPNPGSFWFTAVGGSFFFSETRTSEWQVWPWNKKNGAHQAHTIYVSLVRYILF
jgi:hypothetical protein